MELRRTPEVRARSQQQCERLRSENSIFIVDDGAFDVPKPIRIVNEAPFPGWAFAKMGRKGFTEPTGIQMQAWPVALKGHDMDGIAETGNGKTFAYVLPMLT